MKALVVDYSKFKPVGIPDGAVVAVLKDGVEPGIEEAASFLVTDIDADVLTPVQQTKLASGHIVNPFTELPDEENPDQIPELHTQVVTVTKIKADGKITLGAVKPKSVGEIL